MLPFLFTIGLCALSHTAKLQALQVTDLLPTDDTVQIAHLANGVKTYIQEHSTPCSYGSFRVVIKKTSCEQESFCYEGQIESMDAIEHFFNYCKEKASIDFHALSPYLNGFDVTSSDLPNLGTALPQEIAVIAVGSFQKEDIEGVIEKHFGTLQLSDPSSIAADQIRIGIDPKVSEVALTLAYPIPSQSIQTQKDLKEAWKVLLLQDLFQQRLEQCSRRFKKAWVHPYPRFFYPVNGYSLASYEDCENLLAFFLWQVEMVRFEGFYEEEFHHSKYKLLNHLRYLASRSIHPDSNFLASYFADQFLLGDRCPPSSFFIETSIQLIQEITLKDLLPHLRPFLFEKNRSIQLAYPSLVIQDELLTKDDIETMISKIGSLMSFYRESELSEEEASIWLLRNETLPDLDPSSSFNKGQSFKENRKSIDSPGKVSPDHQMPPLLLPCSTSNSSQEFQLARAQTLFVHAEDTTASFYQLALTEKEKRMIHVIITTLAEKNIFQLAFIKRSMEKKGKKIEHIHPMRFMGYVLSTPELKSALRSIKKSSFKWDAFIDGFSRRMREEHDHNNVYIHIPGFSNQIDGNPEVITRYIQKKDWEGLIREYL